MAESVNPSGLPLGPEPKKAQGHPLETAPVQEPRLSPSQELLRYFAHSHLPQPLQQISRDCADLAQSMQDDLPDGPEKTMGLRKLLEAKDCFVRAALPPAPAYPLVKSDPRECIKCGATNDSRPCPDGDPKHMRPDQGPHAHTSPFSSGRS